MGGHFSPNQLLVPEAFIGNIISISQITLIQTDSGYRGPQTEVEC